MTNATKLKPPQHPLLITECRSREEVIHMVEQLIDQRRQFSVTSDDDINGWILTYASGPTRSTT